jgi:hypothetical protein
MTARRTALAVTGLLCLPLLVLAPGTRAAEPATSSLTVPGTAGQTVTSTYTGTISPGANPNSNCSLPTAPADEHAVELVVPAGTYDQVSAVITFKIAWEASDNDEILSVVGPDGEEIGSSDGGSPEETVALNDLVAGTYTAAACAFASPTPQDYTGTITVTTKAKAAAGPDGTGGGGGVPPLGSDNGLSFSATVPSDPQRDESEPLIETDVDGRIYTCGPTGTTGQSEYAQVSEDGGDQFHLLGQSPRGQLAAGGGGDCALAVGAAKQEGATNAPFAFTGLNALVTFSTATSGDGGRTLTTSANNVSIPGVDRQWMTFVDDSTVLLSYNRLAPRAVVVQRSTNRGLTYAPPIAVSPNPTFPGPMRSYYGTPAASGGREGVAYYTWTAGTKINLAVSRDKGLTWDNCEIHDAGIGADAGFTSSDHDDAGNIFVSYAEEGLGRDNYLTVLSATKLAGCKSADASGAAGPNPGFDVPVRVNRGKVDTVVFPWVAAGGDPGRVAVAYYGTETDGDPNTGDFKATWDVYVSQSLDFTPGGRKTFAQVKATTHPFHYDSICLNGLGCALPPEGDRSLADFFALEYNRADGRLSLVYNQGSKKPDEVEGHVATPAVVTQEGGPSNGGGTVTARRPVVRPASTDRLGDAIAPYSQLLLPPAGANQEALDLTGVEVLPEQDAGGAAVADGGFTVRMKVASLADGDLQSALLASRTNSLVYLFRFVNGFQASGVTARYSPVSGFTFAFDDYTTASVLCGSNGEKCITYPGATELTGTVDQETGEILVNVPRDLLRRLSGATGPGQRPVEAPAAPGSRFYDATAFALANPALNPLDPGVVTFAVPVDNAPAMDFLLPQAASGPAPVVGPGGKAPSAGPGARPGGGPLPATGGLGAPLAAMTLVAVALVLVRGRRRA